MKKIPLCRKRASINSNQFRRKRPASRKFSSISTKDTPIVAPVVKENMQTRKRGRYRREDFRDNSNKGSLWTSSDGGNFLFDTKIKKRIGDIILVNIQQDLKKEITMELDRDYEQRLKRDGNKKNGKNAKNARKSKSNSSKIHDKMSTVVIEEINKDPPVAQRTKATSLQKQKKGWSNFRHW